MRTNELRKSKAPVIVLDEKLEKFRGRVLFPEQLKKVNEILATAGLPNIKKR